MKTLSDVIEEMKAENLGYDFDCETWMRLACEAMLKIVPKELRVRDCEDCRHITIEQGIGYNACRSDILERAEKFMGENNETKNT